MEVQNQTEEVVNTEVVDVQPQAPVETPQVTEGLPVGEENTPPPAQEAYTPNFSYEYRTLAGIREKKEFDDRLKQIIKTKEDEDFVRQMVTKAEGLDVNKRNLTQIEEKYANIEKEYSTIKHDVDFVLAARDRGDVFTALQAIGFNKQQIREAVYHDLEAEKLTPQQRQAYDRKHELENSTYHLNRKIQELEQKTRSFEVQSRTTELESIINAGDIAPIAQDFDRRNGPNAFWNEVVSRGLMYATQMGIEKKPAEVVQEIITKYSLRAPETKPTPTSSAPKTLPVLPNTGSNSSSVPVRPKPLSVKSLKEYAKNLED